MSLILPENVVNIARGKVTGAKPIFAYGKVIAGGAASGLLWANGTFTYPSAAGEQMHVVSSSANDTNAAGTGIRTLVLMYLDANLAEQTETITMNGIAAVSTVATNIRFIQDIYMLTVGSGAKAAGNISVTDTGGTKNYGYILAGDVRSTNALRMVPASKRIIVAGMHAGSVDGATAAQAKVWLASPQYETADFETSAIFIPRLLAVHEDNSDDIPFPCPLAFTAGQSVGLTYSVDKAATVAGSWIGWQENV